MPAAALAPADTICRDASCQHATSHIALCECHCGGKGHGSAIRAPFPTTARRRDLIGGFSSSMLAALDDEPW